jgi:hypothetical protein
MDLMPPVVIDALESVRWSPKHPRPDDPIAYELVASDHLEFDGPGRTRASLPAHVEAGLALLDAARVDPVVFEDPDTWVRTFLTVSPGTWTLPSAVIRRLAAVRSNIWIDAT